MVIAKAISYLKKVLRRADIIHQDMAMKAPEEMLFDFEITQQ